MARPRIYSDEERIERQKEQKRKYKESAAGKEKQKEAIKRYQETDKFKDYKRDYYQKTKNKIEV